VATARRMARRHSGIVGHGRALHLYACPGLGRDADGPVLQRGSDHVQLQSVPERRLPQLLSPQRCDGGRRRSGPYFDGINFEQYVYGTHSVEGSLDTYLSRISGLLQADERAKPLFSSEGSWGKSLDAPDGGVANEAYRDSYVARYYLVLASHHVTYAVWYAYDEPSIGGLYDPATHESLPGASAWKAVYSWLVGSRVTAPCAVVRGTTWGCSLTLSGGEQALAVWDSAATCSGAVCETQAVLVPKGSFTHFRSLDGSVSAITGSTIRWAYSPS
jgi:hypothetical protein